MSRRSEAQQPWHILSSGRDGFCAAQSCVKFLICLFPAWIKRFSTALEGRIPTRVLTMSPKVQNASSNGALLSTPFQCVRQLTAHKRGLQAKVKPDYDPELKLRTF